MAFPKKKKKMKESPFMKHVKIDSPIKGLSSKENPFHKPKEPKLGKKKKSFAEALNNY